jgi:HD-GYP domain-containing protein (c-di-GMP phosphodiesterase class II)
MRLGKTVRGSDGRVLLHAGTELKDAYVEPLLRHGVAGVYVINELAPDVVPPDVVSEQTRQGLTSELRQVVGQLQDAFGDASRRLRHAINIEPLQRAVAGLVDELLADRHAVVNLQDIRTADEYTLGHSVNVCILSVLLGTTLGYNVGELRELGLGALMHDIGKVLVPPEILRKPGRLTDEEFAVMTTHTTLGARILRDQGFISYTAASVAQQHHERYEGGGYPTGLVGDRIFKFARVCAVADCYDALTADRVYRKGIDPFRARQLLVEEMSHFFDPEMLGAFLPLTAPYPVGTMVLLSDGNAGVVVAVERQNVDRPRVRVVLDQGRERLPEPYVVDLALQPGITIAGQLQARPGDIALELLVAEG